MVKLKGYWGLKVDTSALTQQAQGFFAKLIAFIKSLFNR